MMELPNKKYQIILADPPWQYDNPKGNDPKCGGITYDTMETEEICKLPIKNIIDNDCVLFLWVTMPKLNECFNVIESWGFKYVTCAFVWIKKNPNGDGIYSGLGHWVNGNAELCLLARKGNPKRISKDVKQIVISRLREHSRKPDEVRHRIVKLMGNLPRIELFARDKAEGWDVWGDEVPKDTQMLLGLGSDKK
jgi:N6-adenosine-specific RNA methylase IME4